MFLNVTELPGNKKCVLNICCFLHKVCGTKQAVLEISP